MLYGSPYGRYGEAAFGGSTSPKDGGSAVSGPSDDVIALRHLRAGGGDCFGRLIARWSSFMHVSVYLEAESPCQFPVFQTTHFGALVRLLFHELLGLQLRRLLRWSSIGAREGFYLLCSLLLEPWIKKNSNSWCLILVALPQGNRKKVNNTSHKRAFDLLIVPPDYFVQRDICRSYTRFTEPPRRE